MKKALLALITVLGLLLGGCGPGTAEGISYESLDAFTEKFGELFAFPTYYPLGFDPEDSGVTVKGSASFTEEAFRKQTGKGYEDYGGYDIFSSIGVTLTREVDMETDYSLNLISVSRPMNVDPGNVGREYEEIPGNQYGAEIYEHVYVYRDSETDLLHEVYAKEQSLYLYIRVPFNQTNYTFCFETHINPVNGEDTYAAVLQEIRDYDIEEAMKMYESLAYKTT